MREYGKIHTSFWMSSDVRDLSDDGKLLAVYLLTSPHTTQLGCFRLPDGYVSDDLGWSPERVTKGFDELFRNGFATRDQGSKWTIIHRFLKWNPIENPNQAKSAAKLFDQVPASSGIKPSLAMALREYATRYPFEAANRFETVSEGSHQPFRNQEQEQEQENILSEPSVSVAKLAPAKPRKRRNNSPDYSPRFEEFWKAYPDRTNNSKPNAFNEFSRLSDEDQDFAIVSLKGFTAFCRRDPSYRVVHAERYLKERRFDGFLHSGGDGRAAYSSASTYPDEFWIGRVESWKRNNGHWPISNISEPPDSPNTRVPAHILEQVGINHEKAA